MSDTPKDPKNNIVSLVKVQQDNQEREEKASKDDFDESLQAAKKVMDSVLQAIEEQTKSPINGICIVVTHASGGYSHAHSCSRETTQQLIGSLQSKAFRIMHLNET